MYKANITNIPIIAIIPCPSDLEIKKITLPLFQVPLLLKIKMSIAKITNISNITVIPCPSDL